MTFTTQGGAVCTDNVEISSFDFCRNPVISNEAEWLPTSVKASSYLEIKGPFDFVYHYNDTIHEERCKLWY